MHVYLQSLAYLIDLQENLAITDYKGNDEGHLQVEIMPCDKQWKDLTEDVYVEDPKDMVRVEIDLSICAVCVDLSGAS